jgi:molecular chaperone DnaK
MTDDPIIGIDLGTTFSAAAVVQHGQPRLLLRDGERLLPSVVGVSSQGKWLVGTPAHNQYVLAPERTVRSIKRKMGTAERIVLGGNSFGPEEVSAFILHELRIIAESDLKRPVSKAVITVPAYFSDAQRQATKDAGEVAGLDVVRIINEPTAAALAYGLNRADDQMVLVYDLGGGTFDVSLVELTAGVVEVRASHGDTQLGGDDFDQRLALHVAHKFAEQRGTDLTTDRHAMARLLRAAERAKIELSEHPFAWFREEFLADTNGHAVHLEHEVARTDFEALIRPLIKRTLDSVDRVLGDASMGPNEIDRILLVGGSTRIPLVWRLLAEHTGIEPQMAVNPEEAVALGAGIQAAIVAGQSIGTVLVDVTPFSLGIEVATTAGKTIVPDMYRPIIRRNTVIPATREEVFRTVYPGQDSVEVVVYQGEHPIASQNQLLGRFRVEGLKPEAPGDPARVTVCFDIDVNGILRVQAADRAGCQQRTITITAAKERLSAEEISRATEQVTTLLAAPETVDFERDEVEVMLHRARTVLETGALHPDQAEQLQLKIEEVDHMLRTGDYDALANRMEELVDLLLDLEA